MPTTNNPTDTNSSTESMVDRVARAIAHETGDDYRNVIERDYYRMARNAIEAMREPTEKMKWAGQKHHWGDEKSVSGDDEQADNCGEIYRAMIEAALK